MLSKPSEDPIERELAGLAARIEALHESVANISMSMPARDRRIEALEAWRDDEGDKKWADRVDARLDELEARCSKCGMGHKVCNCMVAIANAINLEKRIEALEAVKSAQREALEEVHEIATSALDTHDTVDKRLTALEALRKPHVQVYSPYGVIEVHYPDGMTIEQVRRYVAPWANPVYVGEFNLVGKPLEAK